MSNFLIEKEIKKLVETNLEQVVDAVFIKKIVDSGEIPELTRATYYQGKVRANFSSENLLAKDGRPLRIIIATDQISTHDQVRGAIPFRGQILTNISNEMLAITEKFIPNAQIYAPDNSAVVISEDCAPYMFEMVWRTHMCKSSTETSLYYHYVNLGERKFCGHFLPDGLIPNGPLPYMMDTPSTKASGAGEHDISVSPGYLYQHGVVVPHEYGKIAYMTGAAYQHVQNLFAKKGIIIPDTKFELGKTSQGKIITIDEVLTPDSSRFWEAQDYEKKMAANEAPTSYSKQFGRNIGTPGQPYTEDERFLIGCRYIETYQKLMGKRFVPDKRPPVQRVIDDIRQSLDKV